jgi:hypothetical protein
MTYVKKALVTLLSAATTNKLSQMLRTTLEAVSGNSFSIKQLPLVSKYLSTSKSPRGLIVDLDPSNTRHTVNSPNVTSLGARKLARLVLRYPYEYFRDFAKRTFGFSFYYLQGLALLLFVDACLTDDEPLWEPIEWSLVQT